MRATANARFAIRSWDEKPYSEGPELPKMTRATVTKTFTGDIDGEGRVEYVIFSVVPGSATRDLGGLVGDGASSVGHATDYPFALSYELT